MLLSDLFSNKTSLHRDWNLPLVLKLLQAGPAASLAAPRAPHPQFPCTNSSSSLPCAGATGSAPRCGSTGSVLVLCAVNPIHLQQGPQGKHNRSLSTATCRQALSWPDVIPVAPAATEPFWSCGLPTQITGAVGQGLSAPG